MESVKKFVTHPDWFKEARYGLIDSLPCDLGSLSIGYSHGEPKIYYTKLVGQEGCIDWNIASFVSMWKTAIQQRQFTPELRSLFQDVSNELMPGFAFDMGTFHWFLRPHAQDAKLGFAIFGSRSFNLLSKNDEQSLKNLQFLSQNLKEFAPLSSFAFRRWNNSLSIGNVVVDVFAMVGTTSNIFLQICFKFLFDANIVTTKAIECMSGTTDGAGARYTGDGDHTMVSNGGPSQHSTSAASTANGNVDASSDQRIDTQNQDTSVASNTKQKTVIQYEKGKRYTIQEKQLLLPSSTFEWLINNKFMLLSASMAGLAVSAASKGISRDLRVKL